MALAPWGFNNAYTSWWGTILFLAAAAAGAAPAHRHLVQAWLAGSHVGMLSTEASITNPALAAAVSAGVPMQVITEVFTVMWAAAALMAEAKNILRMNEFLVQHR